MSLHYDEKGKFFTDYVSKRSIEAIIQTPTNRIHGLIYVRVNDRVSDELNRAEQFLAITDAEIYSLEGEKLYTSDFLAVNREMIVWLLPNEPDQPEEDETDAGGAA